MRKLFTALTAAALLASTATVGVTRAEAASYHPPRIEHGWYHAANYGRGYYRNPGWGYHRPGRGYFRPGWGYYNYDPGWGYIGTGAAGFAAGALLGSALSHPYQTYAPRTVYAGNGHVRACEAAHPSYDPGTNTYLTYSGHQRVCTL